MNSKDWQLGFDQGYRAGWMECRKQSLEMYEKIYNDEIAEAEDVNQ